VETSAPPIELQNVSKIFGRFAAVREVSAQFCARRLYAIFGDNGAGKSTLLRIICGLARVTRGEVRIFGQSPGQAKSRLGYMAHAPLLYDEMTGMENLRYFASLYGISDVAYCEEAMRAVGLDPRLSRRVGEYSQGMRQRLSLARATLHDPEIVLLDEPFSNLDPHSSQTMAALLGAMRDGGRTLLIVTHQAGHLADVADESLWISAGAIAARAPGVGAAGGRS
jgi:ABC-type multidrug transport system ATPase subunit